MATLPNVATTGDAAGLLAKYELDRIAPLLGAYEARTHLDVRALSNLQHGCLRNPGPQRDVMQYCHDLKALDETQDPAQRLMTAAGGQNWYGSRILDLVEEATRTQAIADAVGLTPVAAGSPTVAPLTAGELVSALSGFAGRTASEASKETSTTHEAERLARVYEIYAVRVRESEYGNRRALYLANKYMGPSSEHLYPSSEQMPYAAIKAASGGNAKASDGLEARLDGDGRVAFTVADLTAVSAANSRQLTQQAKLKVMTLFVELCGESVPAGFDAGRTGVMPGKNERSQVGLDEVLEYCALLDQGAKDVPVKEAWETIVDSAEKDLRDMTRAPTCYTLGNALQHEITPLTAAMSHFKATFQAQQAASASTKRGNQSKKEQGDDGPAGNGPNGMYSKRQVSAMLKQVGAQSLGKWKKVKEKGGGDSGAGSSATTGDAPNGKPLCRDFQAGRCQRGEQCRFRHAAVADK
ncbi:hypothetical protein AB1Y20_001265 [Prymnesium parvum]|uniref:C3H1-type domain-containing protein n=1 Tax=Prymnesium parvum TaxID=97485 RepID=A0AB34KAX6_PRYPA